MIRLQSGIFRCLMVAFAGIPLCAGWAAEEDALVLVFADDFEAGLDQWTFRDPELWRVEEEDSGNRVLSLHGVSGVERPFNAPRAVASIPGLRAGDFVFEARMKHRGEPYGHQDLCVIHNAQDDERFYYTHLAPAPASDDGANTVFLVNESERRSIATERNDGNAWGDTWHDVRIERDATSGAIDVYFDDMTAPAMRAKDRTFGEGAFGVGSYNDVGWFDDVRIWARPETLPSLGYECIFDGDTLNGWLAPDMRYWRVEDGAITAESTPELPCTSNQFLVWQGGDVADFELVLRVRLKDNKGNSGVQFRSVIGPDGGGIGYQADIIPGGPWAGALVDEYSGRKTLMAPNGHKTHAAEDGTWTTTELPGETKMRAPGLWNDYRIVARGHRLELFVNGVKTAEIIDYEEGHFDPSGILALQLRSGDPMKVQFKDVYLKRLP